MLCEKCKIREANVFYTEIIDGEQNEERHLCSQCAKEMDFGQYSGIFGRDFNFSKILSEILGGVFNNEEKKECGQIVCPTCKTSYDDFVKNSRFGCKDCFEVFNLLINDSIKQIQGSGTHVGKVPKNRYQSRMQPKFKAGGFYIINEEERKIDSLRHELEEAVKMEDYEKAAIIRDRIKTVKEGKNDVV